MAEGDTIYRAAVMLRTALSGQVMTDFRAARLVGLRPDVGQTIETVESHGKHLEITWDDGVVLHTHMRMTGSWHLYRHGQQWRKPARQARVVIETAQWAAVCFNAPVVEVYRSADRHRHPVMGTLGPDLCREDADLGECVRRVLHYPDPDASIGEVLLDQRVCCGVGNVYRAEVLFACGLNPFAAVGSLNVDEAEALVVTAARMLRDNRDTAERVTDPRAPGGLAVYGRTGKSCVACGTVIQTTRTGDFHRTVWWCPTCQPAPPETRRAGDDDRVADPHPAARRFLSDLPARRPVLPNR